MYSKSYIIRTHKGTFIVDINDVILFKSSGSYSEIFFTNGSKLLISKPISSI